jgi:molybdopterin synthase sulfur carrier subunit
MSIEVNISSYFTPYSNHQQVAYVNGSTVDECLNDLVKQFPALKRVLFDKNGKLYHAFDIFINGESVYPKAQAEPVKDGDKLNIVWIIQGG